MGKKEKRKITWNHMIKLVPLYKAYENCNHVDFFQTSKTPPIANFFLKKKKKKKKKK